MTIEIRQLVIRARAEAPSAATAPAEAVHERPGPGSARPGRAETLAPEEREALVAACVREVFRKLRKARER